MAWKQISSIASVTHSSPLHIKEKGKEKSEDKGTENSVFNCVYKC